jgi:hypothetical protein
VRNTAAHGAPCANLGVARSSARRRAAEGSARPPRDAARWCAGASLRRQRGRRGQRARTPGPLRDSSPPAPSGAPGAC